MFELVTEGELHLRLYDVARALGLPLNLLRAALAIERPEPVSMRALARHFRVDASYCTALVDGLEAHGLAGRRPHPTDRRVKTVVLTDEGRRVVADARDRLAEPPAALGTLSPAEQRQLRDLLAKVAAADPLLSARRPGLRGERPAG